MKDEGDILEDDRFEVHVPCGLQHPGLCATDDEVILGPIQGVAKRLWDHVHTARPGSFFHLRYESTKECRATWVVTGYIRCGGPRLLVFASCTLTDETNMLQIDGKDEDFFWVMAPTLIGMYYKTLEPGEYMQAVSVSAAPVTTHFADHGDIVEIAPDWQTQVVETRTILYPHVDAKPGINRKTPLGAGMQVGLLVTVVALWGGLGGGGKAQRGEKSLIKFNQWEIPIKLD